MMTKTAFASRAVRAGLTGAFALLLCALATRAEAFAVNSYVVGDETLYLKWGDNHAGTIGGVVTWSFIPAGTAGSAYCSTACPGVSGSTINLELPEGGFAPATLSSLEAHITAMMDVWSAATGIQFVKIDPDSGVPINDPDAVPNATGQIRIGVFSFSDSSVAAVGYSPPPNGGTGAGDILLNNNNIWYQFAPGAQGDTYDTQYAPNDFDGLILHELGHAIGFEHPDYDGTCPVMQVAAPCLGKINRQLGPDDVAGARFLYDTLFANGFE